MVARYECRGAAALVTIDRPERRNAVDGATAQALLDAFERFSADDDAAVLVLTGAGEQAFCAGADLKALETLDADAPGGPLGFTRLASPKPTIAAISGHCLAGGLELALWCDLRIATTTATFGCAERRWGVPADRRRHATAPPRDLGPAARSTWSSPAARWAPPEALAIGLVNEIVERPVERALELAELIAGFPQATLRSDRRALLQGEGLPLADGLALEARLRPRADRRRASTGARRFVERQRNS